ncbi:EamA family transporter [Bordetella genomosp. 9]|uniref:DMT family transporter n=1 Tax=Bordetella genomosp. 9 TaxID=1416803 RepID=UPI000A28E83E|nr:DMT family transporter [Bordetella genomosp. 9]ARP90852.1 EamA family transporter [Bordetella genomosp. 9]
MNAWRGIACILCGVLCLTVSDAIAKWLGSAYSPVQILFLRATIALPFVAGIVMMLGGRHALRTRHPGIHLLRGAINVISAVAFYTGLRYLPFAEATAISYAAPLCVTLLSVLLLKERVDAVQWTALVAGFAGVVLIVRPGSAGFDAAALLPLATAVLYAFMMITARAIGPGESVLTMGLYIVAAQLVCSALPLPWFWRTPDPSHWPFFAGVALFSTMGLTLITQAFRIAPASVVAPFDYMGLVWAALLGWMVWREAPDALTWLGALVIVVAGLTLILREAMRGERRAAT